VEVKPGAGRSVVRVFLDKPEGVSLEDCERFSKRFSVLLDVENWVPFSYVLEVSSPGLDRRLVRGADFQRFLGRSAKLRTRQPREGQRNFKGKILAVQAGTVELEIAPGSRIEIALSDIEKANLVMEI
jgi:ribosome maturation factor RimP